MFRILSNSLWVLLPIIYIGTGCQNAPQKNNNDCPFGTPTAIFQPEQEGIKDHSFQLEEDYSLERFRLENESEIEIHQSGCDQIRQEFQFSIPPMDKQLDAPSYAMLAAEKFFQLAALGERYQSLGLWGNQMEKNAANFQLSAPLPIEGGFSITIDRINSPGKTTLIVVLRSGTLNNTY